MAFLHVRTLTLLSSLRAVYIRHMTTPFFPLWRARLASLGRKTTHSVRQSTLGQLRQSLSRFIPPALLMAQEEGPNSRERVFPLGLTFQCFIWQILNPHTSCREVV